MLIARYAPCYLDHLEAYGTPEPDHTALACELCRACLSILNVTVGKQHLLQGITPINWPVVFSLPITSAWDVTVTLVYNPFLSTELLCFVYINIYLLSIPMHLSLAPYLLSYLRPILARFLPALILFPEKNIASIKQALVTLPRTFRICASCFIP